MPEDRPAYVMIGDERFPVVKVGIAEGAFTFTVRVPSTVVLAEEFDYALCSADGHLVHFGHVGVGAKVAGFTWELTILLHVNDRTTTWWTAHGPEQSP